MTFEFVETLGEYRYCMTDEEYEEYKKQIAITAIQVNNVKVLVDSVKQQVKEIKQQINQKIKNEINGITEEFTMKNNLIANNGVYSNDPIENEQIKQKIQFDEKCNRHLKEMQKANEKYISNLTEEEKAQKAKGDKSKTEWEERSNRKYELFCTALKDCNLFAKLCVPENKEKISKYATDLQLDDIMYSYKNDEEFTDSTFEEAYYLKYDECSISLDDIMESLAIAIYTEDWKMVAEILTGQYAGYSAWDCGELGSEYLGKKEEDDIFYVDDAESA